MAYKRISLRRYKIATTTGTIDGTSGSIVDENGDTFNFVKENDPFNVPWIVLNFGSVPDGTDRIEVWIRSAWGAAYDSKVVSHDPNGVTYNVLPCIESICPADKLEIVYDNTNGYSVSGWVVTEL